MASLYVYIGSYLKVPIIETPKVGKIKGCSNCGKKTETKFCSDCGGKIVDKEITFLEKIDYYSLLDGVHDEDFYFNMEFDDAENLYIGFNKYNNYHCAIDNGFEIKKIPEKANEENWGDIIQVLNTKAIPYSLEYGVISYYW